ncbi:accessory Sec system protein Asp2, partial [Streptococcus anginosus]|nr:accessory Sec system protein Asp2 [Streptococcus anginosus]
VISKGYLGRHNDNSQGINSWFINQYRRLLKQFSEEGGR